MGQGAISPSLRDPGDTREVGAVDWDDRDEHGFSVLCLVWVLF